MAEHVVDQNQLLIDEFYKIMDEGDLDWERYDRVDDYCWECGTEFETDDGYVYSADAQECDDDFEIINLYVKTPTGEEIQLI
jgi:hypothetical protein